MPFKSGLAGPTHVCVVELAGTMDTLTTVYSFFFLSIEKGKWRRLTVVILFGCNHSSTHSLGATQEGPKQWEL
jgi:hypothetical protein